MNVIETPKKNNNIETALVNVFSNILLSPPKPLSFSVKKQSFKNRNDPERKHIAQRDICRRRRKQFIKISAYNGLTLWWKKREGFNRNFLFQANTE